MTSNPVMLDDGQFHPWPELDPGDVLRMRLDGERDPDAADDPVLPSL